MLSQFAGSFASGSVVSKAALASAMLGVAGCAVSTPPVVTHSDAVTGAFANVAMADAEAQNDESETGLRAEFAAALTSAFDKNGIAQKSASRWIADFAVSSKPTDIAVVPVSDETDKLSELPKDGFKSRWYDKCRPERVRASLAIFDRQTNTLAGKSDGHYLACPGDRESMPKLAEILVRAVKIKTSAAAQQ